MNEWVWSNGGMLLTGETEVLGEKHNTVWVLDEWIWSNGGMILTGERWSTGRKSLYSVGVRWMNGCGEIVGMLLTGENWNTGRKTLYSVGGRGMNGCGAMVEWYWQGKRKYWERELLNRSSHTNNPAMTGPAAKPRLGDEKPPTIHLTLDAEPLLHDIYPHNTQECSLHLTENTASPLRHKSVNDMNGMVS